MTSLRRALTAAMAVLLASSLRAVDMNGSLQRLRRTSASDGGTSKSSSNNRMKSSAGPAAGGRSSSAHFKLSAGPAHVMSFPGAVTDLALSTGAAAGEIHLSWTAPGADGSLGTASSYVIKYSTHPAAIVTQDDFEAAAAVAQSLSPGAPGAAQALTVTGLTPGNSYYFAVEARDADGDQGFLSNAPFIGSQVALRSVDIDVTGYGFGTFTAPAAAVSTSTIRVTNTGTLTSTWSLRASTVTAGSPWILVNGALGASDQFRLSAAFHGVQPSSAAFAADDRMVPADQAASAAAFSIDGTSTGLNVPPAQARDLWLLLETPLSSSTTGQQLIQVTVTAGP